MIGLEHLVDRAMPLPEQDAAGLDLLGRVAAKGLARIPDGHLLERNAHGARGIPAQVLVGEEKHAAAAGERPFEHGTCVGAGADDPAMAAAESLQVGRGIDVGHRHHVIGIDQLGEIVPRGLDRFEVGHVGHAASGAQVGEIDRDLVARQDIGRLGHEMDATEHDRAAGTALGGELTELVTIAPEVRVADHLVLLVMVSQDQERVAELALCRKDSLVQLGLRSIAVGFKLQGSQAGAARWKRRCGHRGMGSTPYGCEFSSRGLASRQQVGKTAPGNAQLTLVLGETFGMEGLSRMPAYRLRRFLVTVPVLDFPRIIPLSREARSLPMRNADLGSHSLRRDWMSVGLDESMMTSKPEFNESAERRAMSGAILIVDDNAADRALLRTILARAGYSVYEVAKGSEAFRQASEVRPHVVILDVNLPDMSGLEVCRTLRAKPETSGIPVLMLTVRHDDTDVLAGMEAGADDYVAKDAAGKLILGRVRRLIEFRQMSGLAMLNQQLAQVGRLLTGIVHEIRGPLAVIRGCAELLRLSAAPGEDDEKWIDSIIRSSRILQVRLDHLMAAVRNGSSEVQVIDLSALILETIDLFVKGLPPGEQPVRIEPALRRSHSQGTG